MWRINRRDRRHDENGSDDEEVQVTPSSPEPSPEPMAPASPADSPKSAPTPEPSLVPPEFPAPRRAAEHAFGDNALFTATSAIGSPGCPPLRGFGRIPV
ncbi:MAG: alpha-1,4-glucan--maltose-1-phosphate maltosyltransferase, partial [Bacillati bacterium]